MYTFRSHILSWLAVGLVSLLFTACERSANVELDLQKISKQIFPSDSAFASNENRADPEGGDKDGDDDHATLSAPTAYLIVRSHAILRDFGTSPASQSLRDSEAVRELLAKAEALLQGKVGRLTPTDLPDFAKLSEAERSSIQTQAEAILMEQTRAFEFASLDQAVERVARAMGGLTILAEDLKAATNDAFIVPVEPLAMIPAPPPPVLENAIKELEVKQRRLKEVLVMSGDPQSKLHLKFVDREIEHLKKVRDSVERKRFTAERGRLFRQIGEKKWAEVTTTRTARLEGRMKLIRRELEVDTGYREIRVTANAVRGPPDAVSDMVLSSLRAYDLDPSEWTRNEARLRALANDLAELSDVPDVFKKPPIQDLDLIASLLSNEKLDYFRSIAATIYGELPQDTPFDYLFADKRIHHDEWKGALEREAQRRATGSHSITATNQLEIALLVKKYTGTVGLPTTRAESQFLQLVSYRFPNLDTMPQGLRNDVASVLKRGLSTSVEEAINLFERYRGISDKLARSTVAAPGDLINIYHESQTSLAAIVFHLDKAIAQAKTFNADVAELSGKYKRLVTLLPSDPGWAPAALAPAAAELSLRRYQVGFEKEMRSVERFIIKATSQLEAAHVQADTLDTDPVKFAQAKGRLTAREADLLEGTNSLTSVPLDTTKSRLSEDWAGRLDKDGQPYSFADVKEPKRFDALGGGIHLGETANKEGGESAQSALLTYEPDNGLILRDPKSGKQWVVVGKEIDATTLKALYRFVAAGRNAAVSIGWGNERETSSDRDAREDESKVLLDPYLVDTSIGQDLVLADLIPWRLDEPTFPMGRPSPFNKTFSELSKAYSIPALHKLRGFVGEINPYKAEDRMEWVARIEAAQVPAPVKALWKFDSVDEALREYIENEKNALRTNLLISFIERTRTDPKFRQQWSRLSRQERLSLMSKEVDEKAATESAKSEDATKKGWKQLPAEISEAREVALELVMNSTMSKPDAANRVIVECWIAIQRAKFKLEDEIGATLLEFSNPTALEALLDEKVNFILAIELLRFSNPVTLAILLDDKVAFSLAADGGVTFSTAMRYSYVTSFVEVTDKHVGMGHSPADPSIDVNPLSELTSLVNAHFTELMNDYPVLQRIKRYAEIAAFFRWAKKAEAEGELALIDLGNLGTIPANDRINFPTVDSLQRK